MSFLNYIRKRIRKHIRIEPSDRLIEFSIIHNPPPYGNDYGVGASIDNFYKSKGA